MERLDKENIIITANVLKSWKNTNNPFIIASALEIDIVECDVDLSIMKGSSFYSKGKREIKLNCNYDYKSKKIICAHELGHIVLAHTGKKYYNDNDLVKEYCANLFAVALLFDNDSFNCDIVEMSNYTLQVILDTNLNI